MATNGNDMYAELMPDDVEGAVGSYLQMAPEDAAEDSGYLGLEPDWISEQWELLNTQSWFKGKIGRGDVTNILGGVEPGSFLVRASSKEGHFALSIMMSGGIEHMLVYPSEAPPGASAPGNTQYRLMQDGKSKFNTIPKLVAYYMGNPIEFHPGSKYHQSDYYLSGSEVEPETQEGGYLAMDPDENIAGGGGDDDVADATEAVGYLALDPEDMAAMGGDDVPEPVSEPEPEPVNEPEPEPYVDPAPNPVDYADASGGGGGGGGAINPQLGQLVDKLFEFIPPEDGCLGGGQLRGVMAKSLPPLPNQILGAIWAMCDTDNAGKLNYDQLITLFGLMSLAQNGQKPDVAGIGPDTPPPKIEGISLDDPAGGGGGSFDDNEAITAMATKLFGMFKQGPDGSLQAGQLKPVMEQSKPPLSPQVLGGIWQLCDDGKKGHLLHGEVKRMFGLMSLAQTGGTPEIANLDASLAPPSITGL